MIEFKFQIGDVVTHKTMVPPFQTKDGRPQHFTIVGRLYDECPGGIQKHYRCRITSQDWGGTMGITRDLYQLHEEELVALP